ncbi:hypothetical protein F511_11522 [Dorcoceras hygrometricum]|uniref:Uncharacterized protein n=1 Tax=Dorcoceras hygrometricum TaxID=472368 RepID=A0A2Z7AMD0_9LAMI|nr:hypothetical protein F511_11522 [Dorcoceras hygrometricum]
METPQSTRIVTRSHTLVSSANNDNLMLTRRAEESESSSETRQTSGKKPKQDRSALIDVTNDSPIAGLAMGSLGIPSSAMSNKRYGIQAYCNGTPGSGETLLRGQAKTLLQKVDEDPELSLTTVEEPFFNLRGLMNNSLSLLFLSCKHAPCLNG